MKTLFIKDISSGSVLEDFIGGLKTVSELKDKNGNVYYGLEVIDNSGSIKAKIWSDGLENVEKKALIEGVVVKLSGAVSEFRGEKQLVINELMHADEGEYEMADIMPATTIPIDEMYSDLENFVSKVKDESIKALLKNFFDKYGEQFKNNPAAGKLHHAYRGGLLEHVLELLSSMEAMKRFYTMVDYDLVTAGIIMHDVGKLREISVSGFINTKTDVGKLKGHLILSYDMLNECAPKDIDSVKLKKLQHIILSHHGALEYGSPVMPMTLEAIMVHKLDDLSAGIRQYKRVIDESDGSTNEFSQRDWAINTEVYLK